MDVVASVISLVNLAIQEAPEVEKVYADGKNIIRSLFSAGLVSADVQNQYMAWSDAHMAATLAGTVPPEFVVTP